MGKPLADHPALLRESRTPYFQRGPDQVPCANTFEPALWLDGRAAASPALVPFSGGPAACPGRDLVFFTTSAVLANLVQQHGATLTPGDLPLTLDNFGLRFEVTAR
ncbi:cytochrome P450 [Amycolatopsis sp. CA-161197]|uniref:cytochrome P450 n=1 Tax=unclassified Amycolatopsis TaxID=2618356 RepID=UPI0036D14CF1